MIFPAFSQFSTWSKKQGIIPFFSAIPVDKCASDPYPYFLACNKESGRTFFLDSFNSRPRGRYSYFPLSDPVFEFSSKNEKEFSRGWNAIKSFFSPCRGPQLHKDVPPFYGGAVGFLSYDCGRFFEKGWRTPAPPDRIGLPLMSFLLYNDIACFDHKMNRVYIFSCLNCGASGRKGKREAYEGQVRRVAGLVHKFKKLEREISLGRHAEKNRVSRYSRRRWDTAVTETEKEKFINSVKRIKNYISAGDIYQANLSQRVGLDFAGAGTDFFGHLRRINPSPYSCYLRYPEFEIASSSPELLLRKRGPILETRPIAGTRPRGENSIADRKLKGELLLSGKECAEHIMLVDLERNDLGRVCRAGSVKVTEKMAVEKYSHVMHIVSHIRGKMKAGGDIFSALTSLFPGGTITGCPKVRCMEILDELEKFSRGPFFGSAGWIGYSGEGEFNLLIRTAVIQDKKGGRGSKRIYIQAGSGIVADSIPETEYRESLQKARALMEAVKPFESK